MATLNEYFRTEALDFLNELERSLQRTPAPDAAELHRTVRGLRGTAQMARDQRVFDVVSAFESVTRAIADGALAWSDGIAESARATIADLRVLLDPTEEQEQLDARVNDATERWREADPDPTPAAAAPVVDPGTKEFREFAAREAAGIADALDQGIGELQTDPMNREPLTIILRRQRALLGSARLDEIPVIADILRAVEDLTRVIVKLDVGVKQEWLDIYRVARDALQTTIAPLLRDELPQSSNSVSRLRHMRAELLERYGSAVEAPPPGADPLARSGTLPPNTPGHTAPPAAATTGRTPAPTAEPPARPAAPRPGTAPGESPARAATLPGDPRAPRSGTVPAAPFMGPARSTPRPGPSAPPAPAASAGPGVPPAVTGSVPSGDDMLELQEASVVEPSDAGIIEPDADTADADVETLELGHDAIIDDDASMLELGEESVIDDETGMLELGEDSIIDDEGHGGGSDAAATAHDAEADALELVDGAGDDDAQMLDLSTSGAIEDDTGDVQLDDGGLDDDEVVALDLGDESAADEPIGSSTSEADASAGPAAEAPTFSREEALQRALELRGVIDRVAAHDPKAREAVDQLFALLKIALE